MLYIGMDMNHDNSDKIFYNTGGNWVNTAFPGSLIIRPVYSTGLNGTLTIENDEVQNDIKMYPNPANSIVSFDGLFDSDLVEIRDLTGRVICSDNVSQVNLTTFSKGVYIVTVYNQNGIQVYSEKLIKH